MFTNFNPVVGAQFAAAPKLNKLLANQNARTIIYHQLKKNRTTNQKSDFFSLVKTSSVLTKQFLFHHGNVRKSLYLHMRYS